MSIWPPHSCLDTSRRLSCIGFSVRHCPTRCLSLKSVSVGYHPTVPHHPHHNLWCQLIACFSRQYCHSYWQARHFQHMPVGSRWIHNLAPFPKVSLFRHTFLIPLWACMSWHHQALQLFSRTTNLMPDYLSSLSSLATIKTELLLTDCFCVFTLHGFKNVQWISKYPTRIDSSSASPPASQKLQTPQTCKYPYSPCF